MPPHRHLLAFFAIAVAALQVLGLGHLVFVTHALCEHGALVEGEARHAEGDVRHADEAPAARGVASAQPGRGGEDHQHCDALAPKSSPPIRPSSPSV